MWAIPEAKKQSFHISVLYPYRLIQPKKIEQVVQSRKELDRVAISKFEHLAEKLLQENSISFDFRSEIGFAENRIREFASKNNVAMLVMGKKLAIDNSESLQELIESIDVPIVIVPQGVN